MAAAGAADAAQGSGSQHHVESAQEPVRILEVKTAPRPLRPGRAFSQTELLSACAAKNSPLPWRRAPRAHLTVSLPGWRRREVEMLFLPQCHLSVSFGTPFPGVSLVQPPITLPLLHSRIRPHPLSPPNAPVPVLLSLEKHQRTQILQSGLLNPPPTPTPGYILQCPLNFGHSRTNF